jgi:hypothetical protein
MSLNVVYKVELDANRLYKDKQKDFQRLFYKQRREQRVVS